MTFALLAGVIATSLVGSIHCVAMCGPLVGRHVAMHSLGRLVTYVAIGAVAGGLGSAIDLAGRLANVQRVAAIVSAIAIVVVALAPLRPNRAFSRALVHIHTHRPRRRAALMGMLTGLIPCGWLWAFALTAGGTGHIATGAVVMAAFWLGTVPAMVGLLAFAGPVIQRLRTRMPAVTAVVMIALALGVLAMRWHSAGQVHCLMCEGM
jgi:sulfite exporter TauE/SafE